ncbi:protein of unknown function [Candidatus Promineifilum breve]|uniref:Uncharacterized protein n=1 Tax=Candidatus Promineifilum breve TaxID=1806508 RepID=A0A160SZW2_9CHLR|nr:protein of unknown function [Candidatus Promineifilum breve]
MLSVSSYDNWKALVKRRDSLEQTQTAVNYDCLSGHTLLPSGFAFESAGKRRLLVGRS